MRILSIIFLSCLTCFSTFGEIITSEKFSYSIDFPEGYEILDMEQDETCVVFKNKYLAAHALIRVWPESKFKSADEALKDTLGRIKAGADYSDAIWRRQKCSIASFESPLLLPEGTAKGWGACIPLPQKKGYLSLLSYSPAEHYDDLAQVLISVVDSVLIDAGSFREPGLITGAFYPRKSPKAINLTIGGKTIPTQVDSIDKEASQFVIDREFSVFSFYAANNLPEMYDAWVRFYRLLARDSMERVKKVSFDIYSALREDCEKKDSENPDAALAQTLLYWSQDFHYERKSSSYDKADIESIPAILEGGSSDCDGRSLLLMCILKNCSIESCMFVSSQYSHALLGVWLAGKQGQTIKVDDNEGGKDYIVGETTAKNLTLGMMPADMTDRKNWMSVELP
ncbi:MAG: hypothetical protein SPL22_10620 [Treponema sp.]|uniref:hypothetical protein n=1 Tax=Treponema sp. TaxID=166 RepID=UPI002A90A298|nr:hypothetical protein [Treponema sp.]MDY6398170.1 hypothetical protein [Treponema sp.]